MRRRLSHLWNQYLYWFHGLPRVVQSFAVCNTIIVVIVLAFALSWWFGWSLWDVFHANLRYIGYGALATVAYWWFWALIHFFRTGKWLWPLND